MRKAVVSILAFVLMFSVLLSIICQVHATPVVIADADDVNFHSGQRKLVRLNNGTFYVVYLNKLATYLQVYIKTSQDDGVTWTDETRISTYSGMNSYDQWYPAIAVDSNNYVHVVWWGRATGYTSYEQIWYAKFNGSWQFPIRISTYAGMENSPQRNPTVAVDENDYLHVILYGKATGYSLNQVWYATWNGSWQSPVRISTYSGMDSWSQYYGSISVDSLNYIHTVWFGEDSSGAYQVWYANYNGSWQTPIRISDCSYLDGEEQMEPSLAIDSNNDLHVVWDGWSTTYNGNSQIWYAKYNSSWQPPIRISTYPEMSDYDQKSASVAVDSNDNIHTVFDSQLPGPFYGLWYTNYTTNWQTPVNLHENAACGNIRWSRYPLTNGITNKLDFTYDDDLAVHTNFTYDYIPIAEELETVNVTSSPEINAQFLVNTTKYTTPYSLTIPPDTYTFYVKAVYLVVNGTPYGFTHWSVNGTIDHYHSSITLTISGDTNLTAHYMLGTFRTSEEITPPSEEQIKYCFPLSFYVIMVLIFLLGVYLYSQRETWKTAIPLIPVILWLLLTRPCPPWGFIAIILTIIAAALLINKTR